MTYMFVTMKKKSDQYPDMDAIYMYLAVYVWV